MEQARFVIALVLSFFVFYFWNVFFVKEPPTQPKSVQTAKEKLPIQPVEKIEKKEESLPPVQPALIERMPKTIKVTSPLYTAHFSEKGAKITQFSLTKYKETVMPDSPPKELISNTLSDGTVLSGTAGGSISGLTQAVFSASAEEISAQRQPEKLSFIWLSPEGIEIEKSFLFSPDTYAIGLTVTIRNRSARAVQESVTLSLKDIAPPEDSNYGFEGPSALLNDSLEQIKLKSLKDKTVYTGKLRWLALESRYFMSAVLPAASEDASMNLSLSADGKILESRYIRPLASIQPGGQSVSEFTLFFGPKSLNVLRQLNNSLEKAINFGMFDILAKPCLWLMNYLYGFIPNYGVAIIILTLLVKLVLWPLGNKSYKSMNDMKKLQPYMTEIREKYKDDKAKMNQEIMNLYKTYKINPMGGCLPMIVQIPVFFALYRMLYEAIELRHAPFFGWINDLSAPDRLFQFGFSIPFMQPPYGIPVLTLIMGGTMFLQQKMSPPPGDPAQAKMMMFMPLIFTVIFINFSSGLVLYWLINNILSIAQQYYISKKNA